MLGKVTFQPEQTLKSQWWLVNTYLIVLIIVWLLYNQATPEIIVCICIVILDTLWFNQRANSNFLDFNAVKT